jgi:hypothetical protein
MWPISGHSMSEADRENLQWVKRGQSMAILGTRISGQEGIPPNQANAADAKSRGAD